MVQNQKGFENSRINMQYERQFEKVSATATIEWSSPGPSLYRSEIPKRFRGPVEIRG
jgi:ABC-type uncharacterized transport system auxiliary subunit